MNQMNTLKQMADRFSDLDALTDRDERDRRYQKIRVLNQKGVLIPDSVVTKGRAAEFGLEAVCAARLLVSLYEIGLDASTLRKVLTFMDAPKLATGAGRHPATQLGAAIAGIRQGDVWTFALQARRNRTTGVLYYTGGFEREKDRNEQAREILNAQGQVHVALTLPAFELLKPLLGPNGPQ